MFAINLVAFINISKMPELLPLYLLLRDKVTDQVIEPYKNKIGHTALILDVDERQWEGIFGVIRSKYRKAELPLYENKSGWKIV